MMVRAALSLRLRSATPKSKYVKIEALAD